MITILLLMFAAASQIFLCCLWYRCGKQAGRIEGFRVGSDLMFRAAMKTIKETQHEEEDPADWWKK